MPVTEMFVLCKSCAIGKSHRTHAPPTNTTYHTPFELIQTDLWGPSPTPSSGGYSYYITFVDACTKFTWIYYLKRKSDALTAFQQFHKLVLNDFNSSIKSLQSDSGGEFKAFTPYLTELGIPHRFTCPHTSHQNGTVERKHRQIVEMGLTLLTHASLPLHFWDHSFTNAVFLINRLPSKALPSFISPYQALYKTVPDYNSFRSFGCSCFPLLTPYNKHKFQVHSQECVNLGPSPQHKGFKCLSSSGRIYISKDVTFHESIFPYSSLSTSGISSQTAPTNSSSSRLSLPTFSPQPTLATPPITVPTTSDPLPSPNVPTVTSTDLTTQPSTTTETSATPSNTPEPSPSPDTILPPPAPTKTHHMITRAQTGHLKPKVFIAHVEPTTVKQALSQPQ